MASIRQAIAASFLSRYASLVVNIVVVMTISRLLKPEEIGVFSICMVVIGAAALLRNAGAGEYLIQAKELPPERVRNVFTVLLVTSWTLALVIFLGRGYVAEFYRHPEVADILLIQTIGFVVVPFGATTFSILTRRMDFSTLAVINLAGALMQAVVSIGLAAMGYSFYALAWGSVAGMATPPLVTVLIRWHLVEWRPRFKGITQVLSVSLAYQGTNLISYFNINVSELVMGRFLGMAPVATFNRARSVTQLFYKLVMEGLIPVAMPAFAEHLRQGEDVRVLFLKGQVLLHVIAWPFFAALFFMAEPFVLLMFGEQWMASVPIVRVLCLACMVGFVTALANEVVKATGRAGALLKMEMALTLLRIAVLIPAAMHSLMALAWVMVASDVVRVTVQVVFLNRIIDLPYHQWVHQGWRSVPVTLVAAAPAAAMYFTGHMDVATDTPFWELAILVGLTGAGCGLCWLAAVYLFGHRIRDEINRALAVGGALLRKFT
ncbi:MAG: lipopolysaccharide biosynthesis protein [Hyphomicrobiales bacterium]|nr:lipopolysaccharide biosynthesis protein [Hyphomicrobiales bacterium]MCP5370313.1 lipopolysaccharide biosynthesis protein [Hyphomicrobiales bacterium]